MCGCACQGVAWAGTLAILAGYLVFNLYLISNQLQSLGQPSEHAKLLALARMGLNYASVLYGIGNFKSQSVGLVRSAFGWTQKAQAVSGAGLWMVDCAVGWDFVQRYIWNLLAPVMAVATLLGGLGVINRWAVCVAGEVNCPHTPHPSDGEHREL